MDKADLQRYRDLAREVGYLKNKLDTLEQTMYEPHGQRFTHTPHASAVKGSTMDDLVSKHLELERLYHKKLQDRKAELIKVETAINSLRDPAYRMVLRYRYIDGYSWTKICSLMGYSERQIYRLHGFALLKIKEV